MKIHYNTKLKQPDENQIDNNIFSEVLLSKTKVTKIKRPYTLRPDFIGTPLFLEGNNYMAVSHFVGLPVRFFVARSFLSRSEKRKKGVFAANQPRTNLVVRPS